MGEFVAGCGEHDKDDYEVPEIGVLVVVDLCSHCRSDSKRFCDSLTNVVLLR